MNTQAHDEQKTGQPSKQERQWRLEAIGRSVLLALGEPANLHRVEVRVLWGDNFRANIFTGDDFLSSRIVHSYFVSADPDGKLTASVPPIERRY